jgi:hypothetical protein
MYSKGERFWEPLGAPSFSIRMAVMRSLVAAVDDGKDISVKEDISVKHPSD